MAVALLLAQLSAPAQIVRPRNFLAQARAYMDAGREEMALACARQATEADAGNAAAFLLLGVLLDRRADHDGAVAALARAAQLTPDDPLPRERLQRALRTGPPASIEESLIRALPGETVVGELTLRDARLAGALPRSVRWATLLDPPEGLGRGARDPKYGAPFPRVCTTYALQERDARWFRVAQVRFQKSADAGLAQRVGALVGQLFWIRREYYSAAPDFPRPPEVNLWLSRDGHAGGEEWRGQIYLYEVGRERAPEEWVREVCHEYGHVALPGATIYTDPEPKANGYLGERLLAKWLWDNQAEVWNGTVDLERYVARRAAPLRERFLAAGPRSALLQRRDRAGMEHYIGMVLAWEAAHGPRMLRAAFDRAQGQNAESFLIGCQEVIQALRPARFEVSGAALLPAGATAGGRSAAWLFLPGGRWTLRVDRAACAAVGARWDDRPLSRQTDETTALAFTITTSEPGWHRLELTARPAAVRRLEFVRG
jgi:tetratricopeptide (TPR) repeat protein